MPNHKSDDHIPAIVLEKEDIKPKGKTSKSNHKKAPNEVQSNKTSVFPIILTLLIFSICGWFLYKQNNLLIQSQNRIAKLEQQLSATGEEIGSSTVAIQVKVKELSEKTEELWKQMDKLWASAWRRNQSEIKELKVSINNISALNVEQDTNIQSVIAQQTQLTANKNKQNAIMTNSIQEIKESILEFEIKSTDSNAKVSDLKDDVRKLEKQLKQLQTQVSAFEAKQKTAIVPSIGT